MAKVSVPTVVSTVTLTPLARVLRTVLQTIIAYGGSLPILIGPLGLTGAHAAEVSAIVAGVVFTASAIQNVLEHFNVIPTVGAKAPATK